MADAKRIKPSRKKIIHQVIADHGITEEIFFGPRKLKKAVEARRDAIHRLIADGAYKAEVARLMKRNKSIIFYHLSEKLREDRKTYFRIYRNVPENKERRKQLRRSYENRKRRSILRSMGLIAS